MKSEFGVQSGGETKEEVWGDLGMLKSLLGSSKDWRRIKTWNLINIRPENLHTEQVNFRSFTHHGSLLNHL
jgi:hypothetical protein